MEAVVPEVKIISLREAAFKWRATASRAASYASVASPAKAWTARWILALCNDANSFCRSRTMRGRILVAALSK